MGVPFHVRADLCFTCNRSDWIHLGTRYEGHQFLHRAYRDDKRGDANNRFGLNVITHEAWLEVAKCGFIYANGSEEVDLSELLEIIERAQSEKPWSYAEGYDFADPQGYAFSWLDFE